MTFSIDLIKEKSMDPVFLLNVSVYGDNVKVVNAKVEVTRRPPKVSFTYPDELKNILPPTEQKKLELEMLNKIVEYLIETAEKNGAKHASTF
ncbi:MAG TPA: hypothetical protein VIL05_07415 [Thermoclostridium sp.]